MSRYRPIIFSVTLLKDLDPNVVEAIVLRLQTQVILQSDYAPHDDTLYFVLSGILEERLYVEPVGVGVNAEKDDGGGQTSDEERKTLDAMGTVVRILNHGDYFGEQVCY